MSRGKVRNYLSKVEDPGTSWEVLDPKTGELVRKPVITKQADKASCDINKILERFNKTGQLPDLIRREPRYGDFSSVPDFQEAFDVISKATEQFEALPAQVRKRFNHSPSEMLAFVADPANAEEMVTLGLRLPAAKTEPALPGNVAVSGVSEPPAK